MSRAPVAPDVQVGAKISLADLENEHIARVIQQAATMEEAAKILGIDPATLYRKRKKIATGPASENPRTQTPNSKETSSPKPPNRASQPPPESRA